LLEQEAAQRLQILSCVRGITLGLYKIIGTKRFKKVENATALIWKILQVAESTFRRLTGAEVLPAVYAGVQEVDGVQRTPKAPQRLAA
jgi:hypothetical protein